MQRDQAQLASAQADADRAVMLADRGIVSAQQRDQLVATAKALAASVAADQAAVERAQLNLGYTTIRSPIDGKTGPYIVNPGNQVHASDAAGLVMITEIQPVKISFNLPQGDLPQLQDRMNEGQLIAGVTVRSDVAVAAANVPINRQPIRTFPSKWISSGTRSTQRPVPSNCAPPSRIPICASCPASLWTSASGWKH